MICCGIYCNNFQMVFHAEFLTELDFILCKQYIKSMPLIFV